MVLIFDNCELDESRYELRRDGRPVDVQRRVLDLLLVLAKSQGRVFRRDELLKEVWGDTAVGDAALSRAIKEARKALGDDGEAQRFIRTVHGRGYAFVAALVPRKETSTPPARTSLLPEGEGAFFGSASDGVFVGRQDTMARAVAMVERAHQTGSGGSMLLLGEPGIGKTRTLSEIAKEAGSLGLPVLSVRCYESGWAPAYFPWVQLVRHAARQRLWEPSGFAGDLWSLALVMPEFGGRQEAAVESALDDAEVRFRVEQALAAVFRRVAARGPIVLTIDDFHAADSASLQLSRAIAELARDVPIALFLSSRPAVDPAVERAIARLLREATDLRELTGFDRDAIEALCRARLAGVPELVVSALEARTRGNPFFIHLLLDLSEEDGSSIERPIESLPTGVREAIARHVDILPAAVRDVLIGASILGDPFPPSLCAAICEYPWDDVVAALERAERSGVLRRATSARGHFEFSHPLVGEALYASVTPRERAAFHESAGRALAEHEGPVGEPSILRARHLLRGSFDVRVREGVPVALQAAEAAFKRGAFKDVVALCEDVLETLALTEPNAAVERQALLRLGSALGRDGRLVEAAQAFRHAADLPRADAVDAPRVEALDARAVRDSFVVLAERAPDLIERVYENLFRRYPEVEGLFVRRPREAQARMLADTLTAALDHIEDVPWLQGALHHLGARHAGYGVTDEMYAWFGDVLVDTFREMAGSAWSKSIDEAWHRVYQALVAGMLQGARSDVERPSKRFLRAVTS